VGVRGVASKKEGGRTNEPQDGGVGSGLSTQDRSPKKISAPISRVKNVREKSEAGRSGLEDRIMPM